MTKPASYFPIFDTRDKAAAFLIDVVNIARKLDIRITHLAIGQVGCDRFQPAFSASLDYGDCAALACLTDALAMGREDCPSCGHISPYPKTPLPVADVPVNESLDMTLKYGPDGCGDIPAGAILALLDDWQLEVRGEPGYAAAVEALTHLGPRGQNVCDLDLDRILPQPQPLGDCELCNELMRRGRDD